MPTSVLALLPVIVLLAGAPVLPRQVAGTSAGPGVVVAVVPAGSSAAAAGLRRGDVLLAWRPDGAAQERPFATGFDLPELDIEWVPRGAVTIRGRRGETAMDWRIERGTFGVTGRPLMSPAAEASYEAGVAHALAQRLAAAAEEWARASSSATSDEPLASAWLLSRAASAYGESGRWEEADATLAKAIAIVEAAPAPAALAHLLRQKGRSYNQRNDLAKATDAFRAALLVDETRVDRSMAAALDHDLIGSIALLRGDMAAAEASHTSALALRTALAPDGVDVAESMNSMAAIADERGDLKGTDLWLGRARAILERAAPESLRLAMVVHNQGIGAETRGDLEAAESFYRRGLAIREKAAPDGPLVALSLNSLGLVARLRGDLEGSEALHRRALVIQERAVPGSGALAGTVGNIGIVLRLRGDLIGAEAHQRRALDIQQRLSPDSMSVAGTLNNLGNVLFDRGDLSEAETFHTRALAIRERLAAGSLAVASSLNNLGNVALLRQDYATARSFYDRSLAIKTKVAPASSTMVTTLNNLGSTFLGLGDLAMAQDYLGRGLAILDKTAPNNVERATTLYRMASIARDQRRLDTALSLARQSVELAERTSAAGVENADALTTLALVALDTGDIVGARDAAMRSIAILERVAAGSLAHASALSALSAVNRAAKQPEEAMTAASRAVDTFEQQTVKAGGAQDVRSRLGAKGGEFYRSAVDLALALGRPDDAFAFQERHRARALLQMLAERDVVFSADVPEAMARERSVLDADYDRAIAALAAAARGPVSAREPLERRLRELRDAREQHSLKIRQLSPRLGSLKQPVPVGVDAARASLDPGTALLAYWVTPARTILFVIEAPRAGAPAQSGVITHTIDVTDGALRAAVTEYRQAVQASGITGTRAVGGIVKGRSTPDLLERRAARLYDLLLKPAEAAIARSQRLLIVPDGALHAVPFGALRPTGRLAGGARFLVEWKPLHVTVSATVYRELRAERTAPHASSRLSLAAFGDPETRSAPVALETAPGARASRLGALPAARREVRSIARLFGDRATIFLGADATEARVKAIDRQTRYVHFASHALLDERLPLNSALVLSPPPAKTGVDNGLLQVWEIFDRVRLDAELVTLSACETALGGEFAGEGLIGLTRAFHYAGARTVVASLWSIADRSTEVLMTRFYGHLRAGLPKDRALRAAQLDMIRAGDRHAHPFHWAAFQVFGDWR